MSADFSTSFTKLFGIPVPLIVPPMAGASGAALAAAASSEGGFGYVAAGLIGPEELEHELKLAKGLLEQLQPATKLRIGVGYFGWQLDKDPEKALRLLQVALTHEVQSIWLAFGNDLSPYVKFIREQDTASKSLGQKTLIAIQVTSVAEAVIAASELKADLIVVQGSESGGHGSSKSLPLRTILSQVLEVLPVDRPPVLAAGGLATGRDFAEMINTHHADGVVMGTRFLATNESRYPEGKKARLCLAKPEDTIRSLAFDLARGTTDWPKDTDGRGLRNKSVDEYEAGADAQFLHTAYKDALDTKDLDRLEIWAGTGVGYVTKISSAKEAFQEIWQDAVGTAQNTNTLA